MRYVEGHLGRQVPTLWRVEWKARKSGAKVGAVVPHFHLLLGGVEYVRYVQLRSWWRAIVHVNGPLCTDVQSIDAAEGAVNYLCKYTSKNPSLDIGAYLNNEKGIGRHWGFTRKHLFPEAPITRLQKLSDVQAAQLRGMAAEVFENYDEDLGGGFTLFGRDILETFRDKCQLGH
jgi:hypothetical protein